MFYAKVQYALLKKGGLCARFGTISILLSKNLSLFGRDNSKDENARSASWPGFVWIMRELANFDSFVVFLH
jgi:hypothetical protein